MVTFLPSDPEFREGEAGRMWKEVEEKQKGTQMHWISLQ